jgi:hypothetical protein
VEVVAGTSIGGMLAASLACRFPPHVCQSVLEIASRVVFKKSESYVSGFRRAKFSQENLVLLCRELWGNKALREVEKYLVLPSYLLDNASPTADDRKSEIKVYHNLGPNDSLLSQRVSDVVMRSVSAPTYFPSFQGHIDGGVFAHNPASGALALVVDSQEGLGKNLEDVYLLSFGTGCVHHYFQDGDHQPSTSPTEEIKRTFHDWGYLQWLPNLPTVLWDGMIEYASWMCRSMLGKRYLRVDVPLRADISLDDPHSIPDLIQSAYEMDLSPLMAFIDDYLSMS